MAKLAEDVDLYGAKAGRREHVFSHSVQASTRGARGPPIAHLGDDELLLLLPHEAVVELLPNEDLRARRNGTQSRARMGANATGSVIAPAGAVNVGGE